MGPFPLEMGQIRLAPGSTLIADTTLPYEADFKMLICKEHDYLTGT